MYAGWPQRSLLPMLTLPCPGSLAKLWFTPCRDPGKRSGERNRVSLFFMESVLMAAFPGRFDTEEEAVAIANATEVGLAGGCPSFLGSSRCQPSSGHRPGL